MLGTRFALTDWEKLSGPIYTLALVAFLHLVASTALWVPNPPAMLVLAVAFAAVRGGLWSGLASAACAWTYVALYFSIPQQPFNYTDENFRRVVVWLVTIPGLAWLVGIRRQSLDRLGDARRKTISELEALLDAGPGIIYRRHPETMAITYISGNVERIFGYAPHEIVGAPRFWSERIHPDDRASLDADNERAWQHRDAETERYYRFRHKDGTYRWVHSVIRFRYDHAAVADILGFVQDVTARKTADETMLKANRDAERANLSQAALLSRITHEIRSPLNAVLGFAEALEKMSLTAAQTRQVSHIINGGRQVLTVLAQALDLSRIDGGGLPLSFEAVRVGDVLADAVRVVRPLADAKGIKIVDQSSRECELCVRADRQRLREIFLHLLSNAVKYNRQNGQIILEWAQRADGRLRVSIQDTGSEIPTAETSRLFRPFERVGTEHADEEGAGLGLALSAKLVEAMYGTFGVDTVEGLGNSFWIELPTVDAPLTARASASTTPR